METTPSRQVRRHRQRKYKLFRTFLARVWSHLNLPTPSPVQNDIADYLQFGPKRCVIEAFRGIGKSWITCAFVVWCLYLDPQMKIMIVSAGKDRADANSYMIKRLISELPELRHLTPDESIGNRNRVDIFDVAPALADPSPSVKSVGIKGQLTGSRADVIVADDIEVPKNSFTALMREQIAELIKEFDAVLKTEEDVRSKGGEHPPRIIYLGTPQTEMSIYNQLPKRGYEIRVWPARIPTKIENYSGRLAPYVLDLISGGKRVGAPVDPDRFTDADLKSRELSYGRSGFSLQYMLDTALSDGDKFPLKLEDLMVSSLDPERAPASLGYAKDPSRTLIQSLQPVGFTGDYYYAPGFVDAVWTPYQGSVLAVDPSGRGEDETGVAVVKMLHGRLFLVASVGFRGGFTPENLRKIAELAKEHRVNDVVIESNFGDGMFAALLKPVLNEVWPVSIVDTRAIGQKETRILGVLEPVIQSHRLVVDQKVIESDLEVDDPSYSLFYQMTRLTRDRGALKHDDRLEAVSMAVQYWTEKIEVDMDKAAQSAEQDALDEMLRGFAEEGSLWGLEKVVVSPANWCGGDN